MGSFIFDRPPPDRHAYVTGLCSLGAACEFVRCPRGTRYHPRRDPKERITRRASEPFCGCGAPLVDVRPILTSFVFVGEKRSPRAIASGWTWTSRRLASHTLHDALEAARIDVRRQVVFVNLFRDGDGWRPPRGPWCHPPPRSLPRARARGDRSHAVMTTDLVPSVSIENLCAQRDAIVERVRAIRRTLNEAQQLGDAALGEAPYKLNLTIYGTTTAIDDDRGEAAMIKTVDARFWAMLLERSGLQTFLDAEARAKWAKAIQNDDVPELTFANIEATFTHLYENRGAMFERGVIEVYRRLSWDYKTNCPRMFGKRIIMTSIVEKSPWTPGLSQHGGDRLDDLVRVFSVLDGKPEPDHRRAMWRTCQDAKWMGVGGNTLDLPFFQLRGFKNGNAHLTFKRPNLVEKMNQILGKHHPNILPPEEG